ncbi:MAG: phosphoribosylglycinamide formyltransferase [Flavobacteriaceae bacterium]|nr:phosphoribosylglycinamide formyltransferase [Flavobacteriaceae bacterium LSUCC0859]
MKRMALFASGAGSNVLNIIKHFKNKEQIEIALVLTNNPKAGVIQKCEEQGVPLIYLSKKGFSQPHTLLQILEGFSLDLIVLAGFLLKIPSELVEKYPNRIINIHPALLPNYGGKGMYGMHVHRAVKEAGETESGISIHYVNEHYDQGALIFQAKTKLLPTDSPQDIAQKVQALESLHFPNTIERLLHD